MRRSLFVLVALLFATVLSHAQPVVNLGNDTTICQGNTLLLDAGNAGASFLWSTGATTQTLSVNTSGIYWVDVTDVGGTTRDSVDVVVLDTAVFSVTDTTLCGGILNLNFIGDTSSAYVWWDALSGGNIVGTGQTVATELYNDTTFYIEGYSLLPDIFHEGSLTNNAGFFWPTGADVGVEFDVLTPLVYLDGVHIPTEGNVSGTVILEDPSGAIIQQWNINLLGTAFHRVDLGVTLSQGTGYKLKLSNRQGGEIYIQNNPSFPYNGTFLNVVGGVPQAARNYVFFDLEVKGFGCSTNRKSMNLTIINTPFFDFPEDTISCGQNLSLDLAFTGASNYNWSTGATTSNIQVTESSFVTATTTIGNCAVSDSMYVYVLDTTDYSVRDTILCGGERAFAVNGDPSGIYIWWDAVSGGNWVHSGNTLNTELYNDTTFFVESYSVKDTGYIEGSNVTTNGNYWSTLNPVGLRFDVLEPAIRIDAVYLPTNGDVTGTIELRSGSGKLLREWDVDVDGIAYHKIPLNIVLLQGTDYEIVFKNRFGAQVYFVPTANSSYPYTGELLNIHTGVPNAGYYYVFFNFEVSTLSCPTQRQELDVNILPTVDIGWPKDSIVCTDSLLLDASFPGATYLWSTGETSSSIIVAQADTISLVATVGSCVSSDTVNIVLTNPPTFANSTTDTTVCQGEVTIFAQSDGYTQAWYSSATSTSPIGFGDSLVFNAQDTSVVWVEGINFLLKNDYVGISQYPYSAGGAFYDVANSNYPDRGMIFSVSTSIILNELSIYVDATTTATLRLYDEFGNEIYTNNLNMSVGENVVVINHFLPQGNNYRIMLTNVSGGQVYLVNNFNFPMASGEILFLTGFPIVLNQDYCYFFKWKISTLGCATSRVPVEINVLEEPEITMPADTSVCNGSSITIFSTANNNPAYDYIWSTGVTTDSLVVNNSGYYEVTVTANGLCSRTQDVSVQFLTPPPAYFANDTSICNSSDIDLLTPPSEGLLRWSDLTSINDIIYMGAPYSVYIEDATSYQLEMAARATTRLGELSHPNPTDQGQYQGFIIGNTFDVYETVILDSVAVYVQNAPASFDIVLRDDNNNELSRTSAIINNAQTKAFIPLNYVILPGNQYQIEFDNVSSNFLIDMNVSYPQTTSANVVELTGTIFPGVSFNSFYDWHFSYALPGCSASVVDTFTVDVTLPLYLQDSAYACDTITLNASNGGASSYLWNTGANSSSILADTAGLYTVFMTDGASCSVTDSILVEGPMPVGFPDATVLCDTILTTNYESILSATYQWSTGDTTNTTGISTPGIYSVTVSTAEGCVLEDTINVTQIEAPLVVDLGTFVNICSADTLDAGLGGLGMSYLWSTGETTQTILAGMTGNYEVTVTSPNNCAGTDAVFVQLDTAPQALFSYTTSGSNAISFSNNSVNAQNYFWDFGDGTSTTFSQPFHFYADTGCYVVTLVAFNDCGMDTIIEVLAVGVNQTACDTVSSTVSSQEVNPLTLKLFPNPTSGQINLDFSETVQLSQEGIQIYNLQGQLVQQQLLQEHNAKVISINIIDLPEGMYILRCTTRKRQFSKPLILKK